MQNKGYSESFLEQLKAKNDIVSVLSKYLRLEKKGKSYWACCPFHHEKTPSFCINEYEGYYHCFGCKESGDVITFMMKYENLSYIEAVTALAASAGLEVPKLSGDEKYDELKKKKERLLRALNLAKEHYKQNIYKPEAKPTQEYIKKRGLTRRELEDFEIGYSMGWTELVKYLSSQGVTSEDMKEAGLCGEKEGGHLYDNMAGRLIFPIINTFGDCIAFSARDLTGSGLAKYKNTTGTMVFDKSKTVYGLNLVKKFKQEHGLDKIIIVEGQMDVIAMHKAGFRESVACLGTAFTSSHAREIKRFSENVVLCLDGDSAGVKAALRNLPIIEENGLSVRVAILPDGRDPDEYLKEFGAEKLKGIIENAVSATDFRLLQIEKKYDLSKADQKAKYVSEALRVISRLEGDAEQDVFLKIVRDKAEVPIDILRRDLTVGQVQTEAPKEAETDVEVRDASSKAECFVMAAAMHRKPYVKLNFLEYLKNPTLKQLFELLKEKEKNSENFQITTIFDRFDVENEPVLKEILNFNFEEVNNEEKYYKECLWSLKEWKLRELKEELTKRYTEAKDLGERREISKQLFEITKKLKEKNLEED